MDTDLELSPTRGASSGFGWRKWPLHVKGNAYFST